MEDSMTKQETQSRFLSWLSDLPDAQQNCLTMLQLSDGYNNPEQAESNRPISNGNGLPNIPDRFNNIKK